MHPTIVITGGTKGMGRATAELFAEKGFEVCVCARTQADLDDMQEYWRAHFPDSKLHTAAIDLGKKDDVYHFADFVRNHLPHIDVLVNNAGLYLPGNIADEPAGTLETLMEINLFSAYYLTRGLLPVMLPRRSGHIFNICSVASTEVKPGAASYTMSKYALLAFSKALREELKTQHLRVTAILPGSTWTDSWRGADLPEERLVQASDVALAIWGAWSLSASAVVEELVVRPQLGDVG